ncbi:MULTISPECIES: HlyD family efflux transporter periplasmic adaptor subunit [unclassified Halomonas]|uniref:HlyD family efflux transporter periplasmic adaptor subunit n=1 Tax=unclassified Halomonas TaxID=2609666 RepID=UPI00209D0C3D|nr:MULTISPECIES: HlyD family efflux transporter periplasmic adaptor subunit [unclassified Halomonas]MCP1313860.1 HlyD family efflux transporter periplasmic adaptor subunit [Halomonas sp. 707D7]MCP1326304.1 HlyD family efflux transporter periplasmic adaptor subunit [Halomonas sp. 707D4]
MSARRREEGALPAAPARKTGEPGRDTRVLDLDEDEKRFEPDADEARVIRSGRVVWLCFAILLGLGIWAYFAELVEVSTGSGRVIPTSREQVVQSLEGGILADLRVREGDIVESGQILAQLDPTQSQSNVEESAVRRRAALAQVARLEAEVNDVELVFPAELDDYTELVELERLLYQTRRRGLEQSLAGVNESLALVREELGITRSLMEVGAASNVEVLRLQRQATELALQAADIRSEYLILAREELSTAKAEVEALSSVIRGRSDTLTRLTLRSPVRGIVKDIEVTTTGGVIPPNGRLMAIVPLDDQLRIEARISPRDIAFIYPGQPASVKITAYDHASFGALEGEVVLISPDTLQDETQPDVFYYRVIILTERDALFSENGTRYPIVPGMVATVDIRTGSKTVFDYLVKPISLAREALRER